MLSETSLLHAIPPRPVLRVNTSAPISSVMPSSSRHAATIRRSSRTANALDKRSMPAPAGWTWSLPGEELPELGTVLGTLLEHAGPARVIGFRQKRGPVGVLELDHLNA